MTITRGFWRGWGILYSRDMVLHCIYCLPMVVPTQPRYAFRRKDTEEVLRCRAVIGKAYNSDQLNVMPSFGESSEIPRDRLTRYSVRHRQRQQAQRGQSHTRSGRNRDRADLSRRRRSVLAPCT